MYKDYLKRAFDIFFAFILLCIISPLFLLIYVVLIITQKGSPFFRQIRPGRYEKPFTIIKFKTMSNKRNTQGELLMDNERITNIGSFLRKSSLDEIPQLINVLKGEMSFIGPRPERKVFIEKLIESIPLYDSRHLIKPGITGWAQVKYDYGENIEDSYKKLEYDLYYIKNRSVTLDIRIIFKTINTIAFYKGL